MLIIESHFANNCLIPSLFRPGVRRYDTVENVWPYRFHPSALQGHEIASTTSIPMTLRVVIPNLGPLPGALFLGGMGEAICEADQKFAPVGFLWYDDTYIARATTNEMQGYLIPLTRVFSLSRCGII